MDQKEIIRIEGLTKRFSGKNGDVVALEGIDLSINQGEIFGIIGLSGAGKDVYKRQHGRNTQPMADSSARKAAVRLRLLR